MREQLVTDLPSSKDFAAAELRLGPNAYRELHWHRVAEWAYVLGGSGRVVAIDEDGKQFVGDIYGPTNGTEGDTYVFPEGGEHNPLDASALWSLSTGGQCRIPYKRSKMDWSFCSSSPMVLPIPLHPLVPTDHQHRQL